MWTLWTVLWACAPAPVAPDLPASTPSRTVAETQAPTVILVVGCTLRADRLGVYGNPRHATPYLDALAHQGAWFEKVLSNAPWTRPSIAALFTSRHPLTLAIDDKGDDVEASRGIAPEIETAAERFVAHGYRAVGVTANPNANARLGFAQGMEAYSDTTAWHKDIVKVAGDQVVADFLKLAGQVKGPLFGTLVMVDTHRPLEPLRLQRWRLGLFPFGQDLLGQYDAALSLLDDHVRALDQGLAALGRSDRLLVVVGDHGEGLLHPRAAGRSHARYVQQKNLHVPWILHGPGVAAGQRIGGLSQSLDVLPTVAELAGLPANPEWVGRSQAAAVRGQASTSTTVEVFSVTRYAAANRQRYSTPDRSLLENLRTNDQDPPARLYATADELEEVNLATAEPRRMVAMQERAEALRASFEERVITFDAEVPAAELQQLRALGYVEDLQ